MRGKRDYAMLALLVGCGFRSFEGRNWDCVDRYLANLFALYKFRKRAVHFLQFAREISHEFVPRLPGRLAFKI